MELNDRVAGVEPRTLSARDVRLRYAGGTPVLAGADLTLQQGRRVALVGSNGAGKTTLLRILSGVLKPDAGDVHVDTRRLRYTRGALTTHRQTVQLVLQNPDDQLFSADVYADVSFGPTNLGLDAPTVRERVEETLELLGIEDLAHRPTHHLSFGQRKRVSIAGAIAMRPSFLLLDEPTSGLDPAGVEALLTTLGRLEAAGTAVALSTHDLALAWSWADEVALVSAGLVRQESAHCLLLDRTALEAADLRSPWQAELLGRIGGSTSSSPVPRTVEQVADAVVASAGRRVPGSEA